MAAILFRCPNRRIQVQDWVADIAASDPDTYESVLCSACQQVHLVHVSTGRVLGADNDEG